MKKKKITAGLSVCLVLVFIITLTSFGLFAESDFSQPVFVALFMLGAIVIGLLCAIIWDMGKQT